VTIYLPKTVVSADEQGLVNRLLKQLEDKKRRNVLRASYYDGKNAIQALGSIIPPAYARMVTTLGWSAQAVDALALRCNLDEFVWPDGDLNELGGQQVWVENYFASQANAAIVSSLIHGVSFLINTEGDDAEPDSLIHVVDALNATGDWNKRTHRLDNLISVHSRDENTEPDAFTLYLDGETITAEIVDGKWVVDRFTHPWGVPAEALVHKPRVDKVFGSSRLSRAVMSMLDRAVRVCIRMEGNADVYSFPQMILLGADNSVFKNTDGSLKASWQIALGRIFALPDDDAQENPRASVQQFQAASPQPHIDMFKQIAQTFSGETKIPLADLGVGDMANPTSAESYTASRESLIATAEGANAAWSPSFSRCMVRALAILNGEKNIPDEWASIAPKWRNPQYLSRAAQADAGMKQIAAVPWLADTEVGLELLGLSEQQIARAMSEKRRAVGRSVLDTLQQRVTAQRQTIMENPTPPVPEQLSAAPPG
jgi:Phage portal protein, SPP1 Gp6-like